ncbi:MAG: hypothetical protein AAGG81_00935 [Chlamydiota bacterium]
MSFDPNEADQKNTTESFTSCDNIAAFYEKYNLAEGKTTGIFGGKSYTWHMVNNGQPYQVRCDCGVHSLGFGVLQIESRLASDIYIPRLFKGNPEVNPTTAKMKMISPLGLSEHEVRLPVPDEFKNQNDSKL